MRRGPPQKELRASPPRYSRRVRPFISGVSYDDGRGEAEEYEDVQDQKHEKPAANVVVVVLVWDGRLAVCAICRGLCALLRPKLPERCDRAVLWAPEPRAGRDDVVDPAGALEGGVAAKYVRVGLALEQREEPAVVVVRQVYHGL
ncbi:MAG: hypothetical protein CL678_11235 [Bdellovibrionaceae bacterium]|nr:hypothetical protein [Pseudobdellovibrionaceae bacterium]